MSVDPGAPTGAAAAASAASSAAAVEALIAAELNALAAAAQALQSQVTAGQVVTAQVLPSNGLTDLINILGNRVAAALPPTLSPGDVFTAQVTGFNGPQILLQVLNTVDPAQLTSEPPPGLASPTPLPAPSAPLEAVTARPPLPPEVTPSIAPPPAVFVAASVRPSSVPGAPLPPAAGPPPSALPNQAPVAALADIEARMAAARAGAIGVNVPAPASPASSLPPPSASAPVPPPAAGQAPAPPSASATAPAPAAPAPANAGAPPAAPSLRFSFPPPIVPSARFGDAAPAAAAPASGGSAATPAGGAAYRDPVALVRALGLPNTPTNVAAAKLALASPQRLPAALATLESALPQSGDPRVATLRTLTAWVGKLDPASPQLAAQISSYVDNVVTGNEPKLAQLLFAQLASDQAEAPLPAGAAASEAAAAAPGADAPIPIPQTPALPIMALAQAAERTVALSFDLKTQLLSLINAPPPGTEGSDDLLPAASTALSAITAVQLNAAQAMNLTPQTMAFTLPMWLGSGYAQARVAIDRDAPEPGGSRALDGDNFHIAFVLDTKNLGIVTVDLQTVGRAFSLSVKTENEGSAKRFGDALGMLTDRLQTLRYRVNSAEATVAARGNAAPPATAAPSVAGDSTEGDGIASDVNVRA
jgi:hypothetical protein